METCPAYSLNSTCVRTCDSNMFVNGSECVYECSYDFYRESKDGQKVCQQSCSGYYNYPDGGMFACVDSCNSSAPYIYTVQQNGTSPLYYCQSSCLSQFYDDSFTCQDTCNSSYKQYFN